MRPFGPEDLVGYRSGGLLVIEHIPDKGRSKWRCICDCGRTKIATRGALTLTTKGKKPVGRCGRDCPIYGGNRRTKKRICKYCGFEFLACDVKASICDDCKNLERFCLCGCGGIIKGVGGRCLAGHYMRVPNAKIRDGLKRRSEKIKGENNPAKKADVGGKITASLLSYWKSLTPTQKEERLNCSLSFPFRGRITRQRNGGFLSSWEKQVADFLCGKGVQKCLCYSRGCDKGWHYEEPRKFWSGSKYFPDFTYRNITIEVVGASYWINPKKCVRKMLSIVSSGYRLIVLTDRLTLENMRSNEVSKVVFEENIGLPTFTLDNLEQFWEYFISIGYDAMPYSIPGEEQTSYDL